MQNLSKYAPRLSAWTLLACALFLASSNQARAFDEDHKEKINGTTLHFRVRGESKTNPYLVILHGGPGFSAHMFYTWGPSLEKAVNVVYLDQRGSGESDHLKMENPFLPKAEEVKDYTIANLVKDVEGVREFLKVKQWYVLGHSWGGMLGLDYVSAHPDKVIGYIDMDGLLSVPLTEDEIFNSAEAKFQQDAKSGTPQQKAQAESQLKKIKEFRALKVDDPFRLQGAYQIAFGPASLYFASGDTFFNEFNRKIAEAIQKYKVPPTVMMAAEPGAALMVTEHYLTRDVSPLLPKIMNPTLIVNGKQDGVITPKVAQIVHAGIKGSDLVIIDGSGHFPFAEQPEKTTAVILNFILSTNSKCHCTE